MPNGDWVVLRYHWADDVNYFTDLVRNTSIKSYETETGNSSNCDKFNVSVELDKCKRPTLLPV